MNLDKDFPNLMETALITQDTTTDKTIELITIPTEILFKYCLSKEKVWDIIWNLKDNLGRPWNLAWRKQLRRELDL